MESISARVNLRREVRTPSSSVSSSHESKPSPNSTRYFTADEDPIPSLADLCIACASHVSQRATRPSFVPTHAARTYPLHLSAPLQPKATPQALGQTRSISLSANPTTTPKKVPRRSLSGSPSSRKLCAGRTLSNENCKNKVKCEPSEVDDSSIKLYCYAHEKQGPSLSPLRTLSPRKPCSGRTQSDENCKVQVKCKPNEVDSDIKLYCHNHTKKLLAPVGYTTHRGQRLQFDHWIEPYLSQKTQTLLRSAMVKERSVSDEPGYIYILEILDPTSPDTVKLKVGRTKFLNKRIDQWERQCGSKEQEIRGYYPPPVEGGFIKGLITPGSKSPSSHRLERLIHLELADLASSCQYLDAAWPNGVMTEDRPPSVADTQQICADCGQVHKEIFEFQRWKSGPNEGMDIWKNMVKTVVERWGQFIEIYYCDAEEVKKEEFL